MARKYKNFDQGYYEPENKDKYLGKYPIFFKSSWERTFMNFCDKNPNIKSWVYEGVKIPYYNPIKQKQSIYMPDFIISYVDKAGNVHCEMIEIKPKAQTILTEKSKLRDKLAIAVNQAKWNAAITFCRHKGIAFRILNREDIYKT